MKVFSPAGCHIVLSRGLSVAWTWVGDSSVMYCFGMIIVNSHLRTAVNTFVLQTDTLMILY